MLAFAAVLLAPVADLGALLDFAALLDFGLVFAETCFAADFLAAGTREVVRAVARSVAVAAEARVDFLDLDAGFLAVLLALFALARAALGVAEEDFRVFAFAAGDRATSAPVLGVWAGRGSTGIAWIGRQYPKLIIVRMQPGLRNHHPISVCNGY